jgi:hypothetical protein
LDPIGRSIFELDPIVLEILFRYIHTYIHSFIHTFIHTYIHTYIVTYHSRFIPEGIAETSRIFLPGTYVLPKLLSYEEYCKHNRW